MKDWRKNKQAVTYVVVMLITLLLLGLTFLTPNWMPVNVPKPSKPKVTSTDVALSFTGDTAGSVTNVYYSLNGGTTWTLLSGTGTGPFYFAVPDFSSVQISATAYADPSGTATQTVTGSFYVSYATSAWSESISVNYTEQVIK